MFRCIDAATRKCYSQRGGRPGAFGARASAVGAKSGRNGKLYTRSFGSCFSYGAIKLKVSCIGGVQ